MWLEALLDIEYGNRKVTRGFLVIKPIDAKIGGGFFLRFHEYTVDIPVLARAVACESWIIPTRSRR